MEKFVKIFVDRPVTTFIIVLVLMILGTNAVVNMELSMLPDVEYPAVAIVVPAFGMSSKEVEEKVINPIESTIQTVGDVENVESKAYDGYGMVMINFKWGADMREITVDLSEKLNMLSFQLPYNVKPMLLKFSPDMMPVVVIAITGKDWDQISYTAQDIKTALEKLNEVSMVMDMGVKKKEIQIHADYQKLIRRGIGMSMVPTAIAAAGSLNSGGILFQEDKYYPINVDSKLKTLKDLENVLISKGAGFGMMFSRMMGGVNMSSFMGPSPNTKLKDVAKVKIGLSSSMAESRLNGKQAAFLVVQKKSGVNMITASRAVKKVLKDLKLPNEVKVETLMDQSKYMMMSINTLYRNLIIGAIAVVLVLLIFLRDFRVVILVAAAIPISLVVGVLLMYFSKMTINLMSLGGLALAVGMLIDNAIVVTESIYRQSEMGVEPKKGAYIGAGSVGAAITASTLTTISMFLPIAFMHGFAEKMFRDTALAVTYTLLASLFISLTFVPSMSQFVIKGSEPRMKRLVKWYESTLRKILKKRAILVTLVLVLFVISSFILYKVGFSLMPTATPLQFRINFSLPAGTSPTVSKRVVEGIERYLEGKKEEWNIHHIYTHYGVEDDNEMSHFMSDSGYESGFVEVEFWEDRKLPNFEKVTSDIEENLFKKLKAEYSNVSLEILSGMEEGMNLFGRDLEIEIQGENDEILKEISQKVYNKVKDLPFLKNIKSTFQNMIETYEIIPKKDVLVKRKLSDLQIAAELAAINGKTKAGQMLYNGKLTDIVVYPENVHYKRLDDVLIPNMFGAKFKLSDIATVVRAKVPYVIVHRDAKKTYLITSDIEGISQTEALKRIREVVRNIKVPVGYDIKVRGQVEVTHKEIVKVIIAAIIGIILMYMVMVGEFESFVYPFVIMFTVPMGLIGIAAVYLFLQKPINIIALIGVVMLFGIVVNNGIVMIDQINRLREKGRKKLDAIVEGAGSRLRPILMTSLTTIIALIPDLVLSGTGKEYHAPMAVTLISGLSVATLFTLFFLPVLYDVFDRISLRFKGRE